MTYYRRNSGRSDSRRGGVGRAGVAANTAAESPVCRKEPRSLDETVSRCVLKLDSS
jgi:hypothetical protein